MRYGSRRRELTSDKDNAGFMKAMDDNLKLSDLCMRLGPDFHVFGEWLVPHSLKTYRNDAWRKFYVFDIVYEVDGEKRHLHYDDLQAHCEHSGLDYIAPLRIIKNPTVENIFSTLGDNTFLVKDGEGSGEGVVLKNYGFVNKYGRQVWAKVVTSEFKEKHHKEMGAPITKGTAMIEDDIVDEYVTTALVEKTIAKIMLDNDGWNSKCIPRLLCTVFRDLVVEHTWDVCKKNKMPTIDFKNLNRFCVMKIKSIKPELF